MARHEYPPTARLPLTVRKLVAVDIAFHGYRFVLAEFAFAVALGAAGGVWITVSAFSRRGGASPMLVLLGTYFLCLAINYVPLLVYAIAIARRRSAREEVAAELKQKARYAPRYGAQQLLLVLPLVIPVVAVVQEMRKRTQE